MSPSTTVFISTVGSCKLFILPSSCLKFFISKISLPLPWRLNGDPLGLRHKKLIGPAVGADFRRLYPANAKTSTCCPSDDNRTKVTNSVTSARSLWWHVGPYFWPADLTRTANPIALQHFPILSIGLCHTGYALYILRKIAGNVLSGTPGNSEISGAAYAPRLFSSF